MHVLIYSLNRLNVLKEGLHRETKKAIEQMSADKREAFRINEMPQSAIARLRLIILWIPSYH